MENILNMVQEAVSNNYEFLLKVIVRLGLCVLIGGLIGSERERHGRAAGMRTHILVCLGAALTSLMSLYVGEYLNGGDVLRIPAQVISGIGFLGAGMIILKDNNRIMGLTTAAGVWATSIIGISVGYGFYVGALITTILCLSTMILLSKLERSKKNTKIVYIEIDDMHKTNEIISELIKRYGEEVSPRIVPPKSNCNGHLGISIIAEDGAEFDTCELCAMDNVVFVEKF